MRLVLRTDIEPLGKWDERELFFYRTHFCISQIFSHVNVLPIQKLIY